MKTQGSTLFILIVFALAACGGPQHGAMTSIPENTPKVEVDPSADLKARGAPVSIVSAEQDGDYLSIRISYSGGCEIHDFSVISKGKYTATYPPEVEIALKHDDKGDRCRGIVDERRYFDLRPLQYSGTNRVLLIFTNTNKTLEYTY